MLRTRSLCGSSVPLACRKRAASVLSSAESTPPETEVRQISKRSNTFVSEPVRDETAGVPLIILAVPNVNAELRASFDDSSTAGLFTMEDDWLKKSADSRFSSLQNHDLLKTFKAYDQSRMQMFCETW
eukprot:CAMPEP_0196660846 /NCGR_PEP_ID=MMETSP1086-20130531/41548_1 /TAXON_ID=77921 /ORGANISM="Cyanoptyche  gloeocystis , Strain SAG4.97" /LENGTH=127 /DNA_ID=CAMNT_0041995473 /DNA_START=30 /DNA_END=410 /DNA_ORIENTATION=-